MQGVKNIFASTTIWGLIVTAIGFLANIMGYDFGAADQSSLQANIDKILEAVGIIIAMYGRITATKMLSTGTGT